MNHQKLLIALLSATMAVAMLAPQSADAIPAFARQYKMSCTTCHAPFPRLKDYGLEFAANGFTIPEQDKDRDFIIAGDDLLKLNRTFPIAVRFDAFTMFTSDTSVNNDLQTPWGLKMLSGGNLARNMGYYFYFFMNEQGEVVGVEDAYLHFNDLGGLPIDVLVGQFQVCDPLMKRELRLTYEDYKAYKAAVGLSPTNLTYDRGLVLSYDIEKTKTALVGMILNGNGIDPAYDDVDGNAKFDTDKYKNFAFRVQQTFCDYAKGGYFYYHGKEAGAGEMSPEDVFKNVVEYHGADLAAGNGTFDLTVQYLFRRDTNPGFVADPVDVDTKGVVAELVISPLKDRSRHYITLLYNQVDSDWDDADYESATGSVTHLLARNVRATVEFTRNLDLDTNRGVVGLVCAF